MLRDAHKGLETMSAAAAAIKDERWDEAKRALDELQRIAAELTRLVGEKQREQRVAPRERHARD
jgi:flagellin-specific chaperone FliS